MDTLRAIQLADEYGLLRDGAREQLELMVDDDRDLRGPGGDYDRPVALPFRGDYARSFSWEI